MIADEVGTQLLVRQRSTPWRDGPGGTTELEAATLLATLAELLDTTAGELPGVIGADEIAVEAIAISGMGETGFLVDANGAPSPRVLPGSILEGAGKSAHFPPSCSPNSLGERASRSEPRCPWRSYSTCEKVA